MAEIELRFEIRYLSELDMLEFSAWMKACTARLQNFSYMQDARTLEHVCKLVGKPEDIKYCLKQLGLKNSNELIEGGK